MFGLKRRQGPQDEMSDAVQQTATIVEFPSAKVPERMVEPDTQRSYEEVARLLGFEPAELTRAQLLEFFENEGIRLYDYKQVEVWLSGKKKEVGVEHWCWRPLREKDVITDYRWGCDQNGKPNTDGYYAKGWTCRPYDRLVPLHALEKVVEIEARFGDRVRFLVSDYATPDVDPFIMVCPAKCHSGPTAEYNLIFDAWDEPGFGDGK